MVMWFSGVDTPANSILTTTLIPYNQNILPHYQKLYTISNQRKRKTEKNKNKGSRFRIKTKNLFTISPLRTTCCSLNLSPF